MISESRWLLTIVHDVSPDPLDLWSICDGVRLVGAGSVSDRSTSESFSAIIAMSTKTDRLTDRRSYCRRKVTC